MERPSRTAMLNKALYIGTKFPFRLEPEIGQIGVLLMPEHPCELPYLFKIPVCVCVCAK